MAPFLLLFLIVFNEFLKQSNCQFENPICGNLTPQYVFYVSPSIADLPYLEKFLINNRSTSFTEPENGDKVICKIFCDEKNWKEIYDYAIDRNIYHSHAVCCLKNASLSQNLYKEMDELAIATGSKNFMRKNEKVKPGDENEEEKKLQKSDTATNQNGIIRRILKTRAANNPKVKKISKLEKTRNNPSANRDNKLKKKPVSKNLLIKTTRDKNKEKTRTRSKTNLSKSKLLDHKKPAPVSARTTLTKKPFKKPIKKIHRRNTDMIKSTVANFKYAIEKKNYNESVDVENDILLRDNILNFTKKLNKQFDKNPLDRKDDSTSDDNPIDYDISDHVNSSEKNNSHDKLADCIHKMIEWLRNFGNQDKK